MLCICVTGAGTCSIPDGGTTRRRGKSSQTFFDQVAQHGKIHVLMDAAELALGHSGDPKYTATLGQLEKAGAQAAAQVTGCDPADLERQLRGYHGSKGLGDDVRLRADPYGSAKSLDPKGMGTSMHTGPRSRD